MDDRVSVTAFAVERETGTMTDANDAETADVSALDTTKASELTDRVIDTVTDVIVGKNDVVEDVLVTVLARGHLLIEDVPGVGKTTLAKAIAGSFDASFKRVQFTSDLLPSDITGVNVFNQRTDEFDFQPGPVFANFVLGDEINRAPPKTQSALLEAMEERQVTTDGVTRTLPDPFCVIATQNDVEPGRTYDLPVAEVDRFTKKVRLGYPGTDEESRMLGRMVDDRVGHPVESIDSVAGVTTLRQARATAASVETTAPLRGYVARLAAHTRRNATLGVSPRGSLALLRAAQARAVLNGRDYVVPDDVQREAQTVLAHRIRADSSGTSGTDIVDEALSSVPVE
ncbi:AAA family ATPase [Halorubrum luteum]